MYCCLLPTLFHLCKSIRNTVITQLPYQYSMTDWYVTRYIYPLNCSQLYNQLSSVAGILSAGIDISCKFLKLHLYSLFTYLTIVYFISHSPVYLVDTLYIQHPNSNSQGGNFQPISKICNEQCSSLNKCGVTKVLKCFQCKV